MNFQYFLIKLQGVPVMPGQYSFKGANFTGVINFPFADKDSFIEYYGAASVSADTLWIDGSSILS